MTFINKKLTLLLALALNTALLFSASPGLIWHQTYGLATDTQQVFVTAIDNYDNMFLAGVVYFNNAGSLIINRYNGIGNLMWNRLYSNTPPAGSSDKPVALFPNNQAGVTVIASINTQAVLTHILSYDGSGNLQADSPIGDTAAGTKTLPVSVIYDGASSFYILGLHNNISSVFKCDNNGNVLWSTPVPNAYNNQAGNITFDPLGNIVAGVFDSVSPQVIIHRYDSNTGAELPGFNTHINSLPVNSNFIKILVDQGSNIFLASTGPDTAARMQLIVNKFDTSGNTLWSTICTSAKGHSNILNSFLFDRVGDVLISGPYTDNTDTLQYAGLYKISNSIGAVLWSVVDSQFLVNEAVTQVDLYNNIYLGTTKTPSSISSNYSEFSFSKLTPDSGQVQWNRSFDNSTDNTGLLIQANNFGDLFFATTTPTASGSGWFAGRIGNAAGDTLGTSIKAIAGSSNLNVFPNPFSSTTNISFTSAQPDDLSIKVYDITGHLLQQQQIQSTSGYNQFTLNVAFATGVYLVKLEGHNESSVQRVVVY